MSAQTLLPWPRVKGFKTWQGHVITFRSRMDIHAFARDTISEARDAQEVMDLMSGHIITTDGAEIPMGLACGWLGLRGIDVVAQ